MRALLAFGLAFGLATSAAADSSRHFAVDPALYVVDNYYPERDPATDLQLAIQRAQVMDRRILVVVGGSWCTWCFVLDAFLARDAETHAAFADSFLILKVNMSRANRNADFLSRFPESNGYPDFFILDSDGSYLGRQETGALEDGRSYSRARMIAFARQWRRT